MGWFIGGNKKIINNIWLIIGEAVLKLSLNGSADY